MACMPFQIQGLVKHLIDSLKEGMCHMLIMVIIMLDLAIHQGFILHKMTLMHGYIKQELLKPTQHILILFMQELILIMLLEREINQLQPRIPLDLLFKI